MRIVYLLTSLGIGGAERQALALAEHMLGDIETSDLLDNVLVDAIERTYRRAAMRPRYSFSVAASPNSGPLASILSTSICAGHRPAFWPACGKPAAFCATSNLI